MLGAVETYQKPRLRADSGLLDPWPSTEQPKQRKHEHRYEAKDSTHVLRASASMAGPNQRGAAGGAKSVQRSARRYSRVSKGGPGAKASAWQPVPPSPQKSIGQHQNQRTRERVAQSRAAHSVSRTDEEEIREPVPRTVVEIKRLDESRVAAIHFAIENMNQVIAVMKERSTSPETEWDPRWPHTLCLIH